MQLTRSWTPLSRALLGSRAPRSGTQRRVGAGAARFLGTPRAWFAGTRARRAGAHLGARTGPQPGRPIPRREAAPGPTHPHPTGLRSPSRQRRRQMVSVCSTRRNLLQTCARLGRSVPGSEPKISTSSSGGRSSSEQRGGGGEGPASMRSSSGSVSGSLSAAAVSAGPPRCWRRRHPRAGPTPQSRAHTAMPAGRPAHARPRAALRTRAQSPAPRPATPPATPARAKPAGFQGLGVPGFSGLGLGEPLSTPSRTLQPGKKVAPPGAKGMRMPRVRIELTTFRL